MTEEEMLKRIEELEQENLKLKGAKHAPNILGSMQNQKELNFVYPYYSVLSHEWRRSTTSEFHHLRKVALSTVDSLIDNVFHSRKVRDLSTEDHALVVKCADELIEVVAKYKKQYLESIDRKDVIDAFGM